MSAAFVELLGPELLTGGAREATQAALANKSAVALYFSESSCLTSSEFGTELAQWYKNGLKSKIEIVFVSSDPTEDKFNESFGTMPWKGVPFSERQRREAVSKKFHVRTLPAVVILDTQGGLVTREGRHVICGDPTGEYCPWKPQSVQEILGAATLLNKENKAVDLNTLQDKVLGFYFSAGWCQPCQALTPKLADLYNAFLKDKGLEIVHVSFDRTEKDFKKYYFDHNQPWLALQWANKKQKQQLVNLFHVKATPSLVFVDTWQNGRTIITTAGREALAFDPEGNDFPWYPKPVPDLTRGLGPLHEAPVVVAFCEAADKETSRGVLDAMTPVAQKYIDNARQAQDEKAQVMFMMARARGGIAAQLRSLMCFPQLPPPDHEHPLEEYNQAGGQWECDGCSRGGRPNVKRFHCTTKGCRFDYCEECYDKAVDAPSAVPRIALLDLFDDGAFYEGPAGDITRAKLEEFVEAFHKGTLPRKQVRR